jgi:rod shape-determining protein MreC
MESFFDRYRSPLVLTVVLLVQIVILATQVKRPADLKNPGSGGTRLIRVWTVTAFTPIERAFIGTTHFFRNGWHDYVDLHRVRRENQELREQVTNLRMEEVRLKEDAEQGRRLQTLLGFREKFVAHTLPAQVIGTSGSEQSRVIYVDRSSRDGLKPDMAVITPDGIVGKIKDVYLLSAQVLMINDRDSGAGVIMEKSRLQGILRGTVTGELQIDGIMADQSVEIGERVLASGGDRIYPKGLPVGTVTSVAPDRDTGTFLAIKIKPAANLNQLEEVLVVTKMQETPIGTANETPMRASDILADRLPTVPKAAPPQSGTTAAPAAATTEAAGDKKPAKPADHPLTSNVPRKPSSGGAPTDTGSDPIRPAKPSAKPAAPKEHKAAAAGATAQMPSSEDGLPEPAPPKPSPEPTEKPPR